MRERSNPQQRTQPSSNQPLDPPHVRRLGRQPLSQIPGLWARFPSSPSLPKIWFGLMCQNRTSLLGEGDHALEARPLVMHNEWEASEGSIYIDIKIVKQKQKLISHRDAASRTDMADRSHLVSRPFHRTLTPIPSRTLPRRGGARSRPCQAIFNLEILHGIKIEDKGIPRDAEKHIHNTSPATFIFPCLLACVKNIITVHKVVSSRACALSLCPRPVSLLLPCRAKRAGRIGLISEQCPHTLVSLSHIILCSTVGSSLLPKSVPFPQCCSRAPY